jgi:hypothetical protein
VPEPHAAVGTRDRHADPAARGDLLGQVDFDRPTVFHALDVRSHALLCEAADFFTQLHPIHGWRPRAGAQRGSAM